MAVSGKIHPMIDAVGEIAELRARLAEREAELATARAELTGARILIEQYKAQLAKLRRMQFGRSSEKLDRQITQLELMLEDLEEGEAARTAPSLNAENEPSERRKPERRQPVRRPLPEHLPREEIVHAAGDVCPGCGGTHFSKLGEDVTEVLEKIPARLKVIRHIRPKLSCRACETIIQAPSPDLPVEKVRPGPGLLANVVVAKYLDGLAALSPVGDPGARGHRDRARDLGRLGRPCRLVGGAAGRVDRLPCHGGTGHPYR